MWNGIHYGQIVESFAPSDSQNFNKKQYEYTVMIVGEYHSRIPLMHAIRSDAFGSYDDFDDAILSVGSRVLITCPNHDTAQAVILGALRTSPTKINAEDGLYRKTRFNKIEEYWNQEGHWSMKLDEGPTIELNKMTIIIDNTTGESITFDKSTKTIEVNAGNINIIVKGDATISASKSISIESQGDITMSGKNISLNAIQNVTVDAGLSLSMSAKATASIKGTAMAQIDGAIVKLGKGTAPLLTQLTMPVVDLITAVPSVGVPTILAG